MEKIKCYKLIDPSKRGYVGHIIPTGKPKQAAIIMIAGDTIDDTDRKLTEAIKEAPEKYKNKYDLLDLVDLP